MCGIAGIHTQGRYQKKDLMQMLEQQHHRGPDHTGFWGNGEMLIGHNRLSIIDVSAEAHQPMTYQDDRFVLAFNGEIYNYKELRKRLPEHYRFRSQSDTEVLLYLLVEYGTDILPELDGMFAIAFWREDTRELLLVRDRFGVKPLHYTHTQEGLAYASEIKALWSLLGERKPDQSVWAAYFTKGLYGVGSDTFWQDIHQVKAGHYATFSQRGFYETQWYNFAEATQNLMQDERFVQRTVKEHLEVYCSLLDQSIIRRFRADVPVGFNVSGGVDSSVLLGGIHQIFRDSQDINAFTFFCNDERFDELPWVKGMNQHTNRPLHEVLLSVEEVPALISEVSAAQDEPYGGIPTLAYYLVFKRARAEGSIVLLDGQGMDEQWAGYDYYHNQRGHVVQGSKSNPLRLNMLSEDFRNNAKSREIDRPFADDLRNLQYRDLFYSKLPRALQFNDRVSMAHSTELREPFLNHELVEYAFSLPANLKVRGDSSKWGLRQLALDLFDDQVALAPKRPLQTPQVEWFRGELAEYARHEVSTVLEALPEWFNKEAVTQETDKFFSGQYDNSFFLWQLINARHLLAADQ